jgi:DNA-directed RNA polymerase subunit RPC12/RpoP
MYATVTCPVCGHKQRVPERLMGRKIECPNCRGHFLGGASTALETKIKAAPAAPAEERIHYSCPRCGKSLEAPRSQAGHKHNCPGCGQRLQVPTPPLVLPQVVSSSPPPPPAARRPRVVRRQTARREHCLECGRDITGWERALTCPQCGSRFCSSACCRKHERFAHARNPPR